jgi:hypothetical protein
MNDTSTPSRSGCLPLLITSIIACLLLIPNGWVAVVLVNSYRMAAPERLENAKLVQAILFVLPFLLLLLEWWLFDRLWDFCTQRFSKK